jgi:hypothetical protein
MLMPIRIPDPDWHQNEADPYANPTLSFTHVGKSDFFAFSHSFVSFGYHDGTLKGFFNGFGRNLIRIHLLLDTV